MANAEALLVMLDQLKPEVVFLEIHSRGFKNYTSSPGLENKAIAMHLERSFPKLVPVDNVVPKPEDFHLYNEMFEFLDGRGGNELLNKQRQISQLVHSGGFEYLNSKKYLVAQIELEDIEAKTIKNYANSKIKDIYRKWKITNSKREQVMVDGIFAFCEECESINAVYLVGAAHRTGIEAKIKKQFLTMSDVEWRLGNNDK